MYTEKTKLTSKRDTPLFYGSYREKSALEELHWTNQKKKRQLCIVTTAIVSLALLSIGVILAITLPPLLDKNSAEALDPADPVELQTRSTSLLHQYEIAGVSSEHSVCSDLGKSILETRNGSVVDSAIVVALCLGVVSPQSCGLGGGLFMTVYIDRKMYSLNARETVPENVNQDTFGEDSLSAGSSGGLSVGIPSEVAGLFAAHQKFGKLPWADLVKTARELAQKGFTVSKELGNSLKKYQSLISEDPVLRSEFIDPVTNEPKNEGDSVTRPRLARTLETLEQLGAEGFYNGTIAQEIVREVAEAGGVITAEDLSTYSAEWVEPIIYQLKNNLTMFSLPFPSGGPIVAMALGVLQGYGKKNPTEFSPQENGIDAHRLIETLKFAAAHRALIADPSFDDDEDTLALLTEKLLSPEYATEIRGKIHDYQTFEDPTYYGGMYADVPDSGTAHVSIIGPNGNAVSLTTTINSAFGAGFMGNQTGIIYNNEIWDFAFPNTTGIHGLPPNPLNFVEPGKQPASSMAPLIFLNAQGQPVLATGGAGGLKILPAVISATWRALYRETDIKTAIDYPRFLPSFNPNILKYEYGLPASLIADLQRKGHQTRRLDIDTYIGNVNSVCRTKRTNKILANADYRKTGGSAGF